MPVSFRILPDHGLVYVRYEGFALLSDTFRAFGQYARDPLARPGQKQLVDLSRVTGIEADFPRLMAMQAQKADIFVADGAQTILVYYAPTKVSYDLCRQIIRSWEGLQGVVPLVQQTEEGALTLLGLREQSISELLESAQGAD